MLATYFLVSVLYFEKTKINEKEARVALLKNLLIGGTRRFGSICTSLLEAWGRILDLKQDSNPKHRTTFERHQRRSRNRPRYDQKVENLTLNLVHGGFRADTEFGSNQIAAKRPFA